ncbi:MAG: protein phosphatase 2C domain-containing protein [Magnetococcales bacterium]|nr:protein phosphatase 2C domain-containing protein [Magnetococcales bacterium]
MPERAIVPMKRTVHLTNAKVGEPYVGVVEIEGVKSLRMEEPSVPWLTLDGNSGKLVGTPPGSGDFQIRLQGLLNSERVQVLAHLAVIPDPRSLWVNKDSDRNDPFWKPNEAFERLDGDLLCVAASKRGRSHAKDGGFRDDDFGLSVTGSGGWHIAVVADGAGSARFSRRGSRVAVQSVLQELPNLLEEHLTPDLSRLIQARQQGHPEATTQIKSRLYQTLATAGFNAAKAIEEEAKTKEQSPSAFSTTIIICIAKPTPEGWFFAGFSIGDGGAAVFDIDDASLTTLTLPDSGEFAGQTRFLHRSEFSGGFEEVAKRIFFDVRKHFTALILMTDGITDPKFPTENVFANPEKWVQFWQQDLAKSVAFVATNTEMQKQFLEWLDFWSPGNHDDRTIAVLVPQGSLP